jgi:hypothetical protein
MNLRRLFARTALSRPKELVAQIVQHTAESIDDAPQGWEPGHFYSPVPSLSQFRRMEHRLYQSPRSIPGIELNEAGQLELISKVATYYAEQPFPPHKQEKWRFFFENPNFPYGEAIVYYGLLRHLRPQRVIEVGSGYSTAVLLDTLDIGEIRAECTCIEPFPELLLSLIRPEDERRLRIVSSELQQVDLGMFDALGPGDILFIDSTHVSKVGSDVNIIFFEILPRLASGVYVHFHDVFYPFEYPKKWVLEGRCWNEIYVLRAFLTYNATFRVELFISYLAQHHRDVLSSSLPLVAWRPGSSLWLRKN